MNRIPGILCVVMGVGVGVGVVVVAVTVAGACSQRQFVDIKQRQQHLNKITRRLTEHCAIKVLWS